MTFSELLATSGEWTEETVLNLVLCKNASPIYPTSAEYIDDVFGPDKVVGFSKDFVVIRVDDLKEAVGALGENPEEIDD